MKNIIKINTGSTERIFKIKFPFYILDQNIIYLGMPNKDSFQLSLKHCALCDQYFPPITYQKDSETIRLGDATYKVLKVNPMEIELEYIEPKYEESKFQSDNPIII